MAEPAAVPLDVPGSQAMLAYAKALLKSRHRIGSFFDPDIFGDPAYEILLDLFISGEEGVSVSVSACCAATSVPTSTALRWIGILVERGDIVRAPHHSDARVVLVRLSHAARHKMSLWLQTCLSKEAKGFQ